MVAGFFVVIFVQDPDGLSQEAITVVVHDGGLKLHDQIGPALGLRLVHMGHGGCRCALLGGEGEHAHPLNAGLLQKIAQLLKFRLPLAGQTGNQAGAQHQTGDALPQGLKKAPDLPAGAPAVHGLQDAVVDMLDGDIQIFDDLVIGGDLVNQLVVKLVGVQVVETDPLYPLDFGQLTAQGGKTPLAVQVGAVAGDVLGDDDQFLHPVGGQIVCLLQYILHAPGAVTAPDIGDGTEGAEIVAALRDSEIGPGGAGGDHSGDLVHRGAVAAEQAQIPALHYGVGRRHDVLEIAHAQNGVDLRQLA